MPTRPRISSGIERTDIHGHGHRSIAFFGQGLDDRGQLRVVQGSPVDRDGDPSFIIAKALQHGLQATDVLLRAPYESKGADRRAAPQRFELRAALERFIERAVSAGRDGDRIGLWVRRMAHR